MNEVTTLMTNGSKIAKPVYFPRMDGSRIPYEVYSSPEIYALEEERIFRGPTWSFVALEVELPNPGDFKSTFVGTTPVVVTRNDESSLSAWVNRCAHRGAMVCRAARGHARTHICAYHQWSYDTRGNLRGVPFRRGLKDSPGCRPISTPRTTACSNCASRAIGDWSSRASATARPRSTTISAHRCAPVSIESSISRSSIWAAPGSSRNRTGSFTTKTSGILTTPLCCMPSQHLQSS